MPTTSHFIRFFSIIATIALVLPAFAKTRCELMASRGPDHSVFVTVVDKIDTHLDEAERPRVFHDAGQAKRLRAEAFQLQAWARLHLAWDGKKKDREFFEKLDRRSKRLEDLLGALDVESSLLTEASNKGIAALIRYQTKTIHDLQKKLKKVLREDGWISREGDDLTDRVLSRLSDIDWGSSQDQRNYLKEQIEASIQKFSERFDTKIRQVLMKTAYTENDLENFVHEWRRQLRWFAIYFQTGRGLFALGPAPEFPSEGDAQLMAAMANNPFAQLPIRFNTRFLVDRIAYFELTRLIDEIGKVKDRGEMFFMMRDRLLASGAVRSKSAATRAAIRMYGNVPEQMPSQIQSLLAEFDRQQVLAKLGVLAPYAH